MSLENWAAHFHEIDALILTAQRHCGIANASLSDHLIERFELAIQTCHSITNGLDNSSISLSADEMSAIDNVKGSLSDLISHLTRLLDEWKEYRDIYNASSSFSYQAPVMHTGRRGRPRFVVEKDQLEYLLSINFNWSEIAALLGVSRMTLYRCVVIALYYSSVVKTLL